jgi:hypothetical protein
VFQHAGGLYHPERVQVYDRILKHTTIETRDERYDTLKKHFENIFLILKLYVTGHSDLIMLGAFHGNSIHEPVMLIVHAAGVFPLNPFLIFAPKIKDTNWVPPCLTLHSHVYSIPYNAA